MLIFRWVKNQYSPLTKPVAVNCDYAACDYKSNFMVYGVVTMTAVIVRVHPVDSITLKARQAT